MAGREFKLSQWGAPVQNIKAGKWSYVFVSGRDRGSDL